MLDTNIILAIVLDNDESYGNAKRYLEYKATRYVSNTSFIEAKDKLSNDRRLFLDISDFARNYSLENRINYLKMDECRADVEKSFLKQSGEIYLLNYATQEKFDSLVKDFFNNFNEEINSILIMGENNYLNNHIRNAYKKGVSNLNNFFDEYKALTFIFCGKYIKTFEMMGMHNKDAVLLDESYHLHMFLNAPVNFVTFDNGILIHKNKIFELISKDLIVSNPIEIIAQ